jgi:hypothetical protein
LDPAALRLLDPDRPFWMSFGQWLFVHAKWAYHRVESLPLEDSSQSPISLEVQTSLSVSGSPLDLNDSERESLPVNPPAVPAPAATTQSDWRPTSVPTLTPLDPTFSETERLQAHCIATLEE